MWPRRFKCRDVFFCFFFPPFFFWFDERWVQESSKGGIDSGRSYGRILDVLNFRRELTSMHAYMPTYPRCCARFSLPLFIARKEEVKIYFRDSVASIVEKDEGHGSDSGNRHEGCERVSNVFQNRKFRSDAYTLRTCGFDCQLSTLMIMCR